MSDHSKSELPEKSAMFPQTAWSRIYAGAGAAGQSDKAVREALDEIYRRYWEPARRFLRGLGCGQQDAEDIAQSFFVHWAKPEKMEHPGPEKGRLRSYLKQSLRRYFINHWRAEQAQCRGGGLKPVSLEEISEPAFDDESADLEYDSAWAVVARMTAAYEGRGTGMNYGVFMDRNITAPGANVSGTATDGVSEDEAGDFFPV